MLLASAIAARLPDADATDAARALAEDGARMRARDRMRAHHALWQATGGAEHARAAREILDELCALAPETSRQAMLHDVPLHRAIAAADDGGRRPGETSPESPTVAG